MKKIVTVLVTVILVLSITIIGFAAGINGDYKGNPIVNVVINGVSQTFSNVPAIVYNGSTMLPLRACVEGVNGIVEWDSKTQTASVIKPETSISFVQFSDDLKTIIDTSALMPILEDGKTFFSLVDIGGIQKGSYTIKCEIINQSGTVLYASEDTKFTLAADNDIYTDVVCWQGFVIYSETYKFVVSMKDKSGAYKPIAVKTMKYSE